VSFVTAGFVLRTLLGRSIGWGRQVRAERGVGLGEAVHRYAEPLLAGVLLALATIMASGWYALWMAPAVVGLLLAPLFAVFSSRLDLGLWSQRHGLFLTVDDVETSPELQELLARSTA
jgi:membrane glycosyltransferase